MSTYTQSHLTMSLPKERPRLFIATFMVGSTQTTDFQVLRQIFIAFRRFTLLALPLGLIHVHTFQRQNASLTYNSRIMMSTTATIALLTLCVTQAFKVRTTDFIIPLGSNNTLQYLFHVVTLFESVSIINQAHYKTALAFCSDRYLQPSLTRCLSTGSTWVYIITSKKPCQHFLKNFSKNLKFLQNQSSCILFFNQRMSFFRTMSAIFPLKSLQNIVDILQINRVYSSFDVFINHFTR